MCGSYNQIFPIWNFPLSKFKLLGVDKTSVRYHDSRPNVCIQNMNVTTEAVSVEVGEVQTIHWNILTRILSYITSMFKILMKFWKKKFVEHFIGNPVYVTSLYVRCQLNLYKWDVSVGILRCCKIWSKPGYLIVADFLSEGNTHLKWRSVKSKQNHLDGKIGQ